MNQTPELQAPELYSIVRTHVRASGPVTAKGTLKYLKSQCSQNIELWQLCQILNSLIKSGSIRLGEEGNTFEAA